MCGQLGVARQGYYRWRSTGPCERERTDAELTDTIQKIHNKALAESFNAAVKVERVNRTVYPTREHARKDVARYIEIRYNTQRLHSALGYRTPQEAYNEYRNRQAAA